MSDMDSSRSTELDYGIKYFRVNKQTVFIAYHERVCSTCWTGRLHGMVRFGDIDND